MDASPKPSGYDLTFILVSVIPTADETNGGHNVWDNRDDLIATWGQ